MKIILVTHEIHPYQGSECAMGWNTALALSQRLSLTVICASGGHFSPGEYKRAIKSYIESAPQTSAINFEFVDQPLLSRFFISINRCLFDISDGVGSRILFYAALKAWHKSAYEKAARLTSKHEFDLVHQLTPISFLRPGLMWKLKIPFFWGPVGGMYVMPLNFAIRLGLKQFCFEIVRGINIKLQQEIFSKRQKFLSKIAHVWAISNSELIFLSRFVPRTSLMVDSAPPINIVGKVIEAEEGKKILLCWSGRHTSYKALDILLLALSKINNLNIKLTVLGAGPKTNEWKTLAAKLKLDNIEWKGQISYHDALDEMAKSHLFVHTSLREAASHVIMEAMGLGLPVICHDVCGMSSVVDKNSGIKIPFKDFNTSVRVFAEEIKRLANDRGQIKKLSIGAIRRAEQLSWNSKAKIFESAYKECLENF